MYKRRWDIEVFFKLIKSNFKFANLTEHNSKTRECYIKTYDIILFYCILERILEIIINKATINNNKYTIKINKSLALSGLQNIISHIIRSTITTDILIKYTDCYMLNNYSEHKNNPRISKRPFTKWYVKSYSDYYKYAKIIDCIENDKIGNLNKNLKMEAKTINIINDNI
jgi:hypothetical protein